MTKSEMIAQQFPASIRVRHNLYLFKEKEGVLALLPNLQKRQPVIKAGELVPFARVVGSGSFSNTNRYYDQTVLVANTYDVENEAYLHIYTVPFESIHHFYGDYDQKDLTKEDMDAIGVDNLVASIMLRPMRDEDESQSQIRDALPDADLTSPAPTLDRDFMRAVLRHKFVTEEASRGNKP